MTWDAYGEGLEARLRDLESRIHLGSYRAQPGLVEDGVRQPATKGTPQGAVISPLLANIYLHYAYDLWTTQWRAVRAVR